MVEYIVKISKGVVKHAYEVVLFRFVKARHKIPLIIKLKQIHYEWSTVGAHRNPRYFFYKTSLQIAHNMFSMKKVKASHNSAQVQHLYESYFLLLKKPALSEEQRYVIDSL